MTNDPKYTSPEDDYLKLLANDIDGLWSEMHNTTGDYPPIEATLIDQLCRAEAIVRDLAALKELDDLRELNNPEGREKFRQLIERANELIER